MNHKHIPLIAALPLSLLAAGFAFGQTTPRPNPNPASPQQQSHRNASAAGAQPSMDRQSTLGFDQLAGDQGYVSRTGAAQDPWLEQHFRQCDDNNDGRISRSEYSACRGQRSAQGTGMQSTGSSRGGKSMGNHSSSMFDRLAGQKGYVTQGDVTQFAQRMFQQCDGNSDGKVDRAEFMQCHRQKGMHNSGMHDSNMHNSGMQSQQQGRSDQQSASSGSTSAFDQLAGTKGYVTQSQAAGDRWLQQHFQQCDGNGDGRLNRSEYQACQRK